VVRLEEAGADRSGRLEHLPGREALGLQVVALVQLTPEGADVALDDILASAATRLADDKIPARLQRIDAIPMNAAGKTDHSALTALMPEP